MNTISLQIIKDLPQYTDADLRKLIGMLYLDLYGKEVGTQVARHVENERARRDAIMSEALGDIEEALASVRF